MTRLFGFGGLLVVIVAGLALATGGLVFRVLTLAIGFSLLAFYAYLRYSLPRRRGTLELPGLREKVEVFIDERGIPHIYANNLHDLYMAQGYVTAQERLWSMDLLRRLASGQLSEVYGQRTLSLDKHFRNVGLRRAAAASVDAYSPETRSILEAYSAGVNARIAEGRLPLEFRLLRYRPQPWDSVDTLVLGKYAAYHLVGNWDRELFRARLVHAVGAERAAELFPVPPNEDLLQLIEETPLPEIDPLLKIAAETLHESSGTNGWAVSGKKTRSGAPMLANDPHLPVSVPGSWFQCHLIGPGGLDVTGVTFPGIPGILLGHNREIAWGATSFNTDSQDVFLERVNPAAPDEFLYKGNWEKATRISEPIRVRGSAALVPHDVLITRHGPVIAQGAETAFSLAWEALQPSTELEAILSMNRARTWTEFREGLRSYTAPPQHFLFAGKDGTIAVRATATIPQRASGDGQVPIPGWTGEYDWQGTVPFDQMPEAVNPECGFVTAFDPAFDPRFGFVELPSHRTERVGERLQCACDLTLEKARDFQLDQVNHHARQLLQPLVTLAQEGLRQGLHPETLTPLEKKALLMLSGWDCCEAADSPEPMLWHQWYLFLVEGLFRPQMGLTLFDQFVASGLPQQTTDRLIRHVVEGGQSRWVQRDGEHGLARIALRSFRRAVALLAAKQGARPERWRWGKEHTVTFRHFLGLHAPWLRSFLTLGPHPAGGSTATVNNQGLSQLHPFQATVAATWRTLVDLGAPDEAEDVSAPGQSGHPLSAQYTDQMATWLKGEYYVQLNRHKVIRTLPCLELRPRTLK